MNLNKCQFTYEMSKERNSSLWLNLVDLRDGHPTQEESLIMNESGDFVDAKKTKTEEIKPQWEPSNFKALF